MTRRRVATRLIGLSPNWKAALTMLADAVVLLIAAVMAVGLADPYLDVLATPLVALIPAGPAITLPILFALGGYQAVVRYIGADFVGRIAIAMGITAAALEIFYGTLGHLREAWNVALLYGVIGFCGVTLLRLTVRRMLQPRAPGDRERVLIYGAGEAGRQLAAALIHGTVFRPVGFVDDHERLQGRTLLGLKIHRPQQLASLKNFSLFDSVLLAMPAISHKRRQAILRDLSELSVKVMTMPRLDDIASGRKQIDDLREIQIEDLLGRAPVAPDEGLLDGPLRDRVVMITGAGGSIGSELCRLAQLRGAKRLVLFESSEYALYTIDRELRANAAKYKCEIVPVLGSVTDAHVLGNVLRQNAVETLYHAAAYKHVPLVENNIAVAIQNNVLGTWHTAETAMSFGVQNFVLVSTDKAVRPTSVMGASKRICELVVQAMGERYAATRVAIVRFGNVLGSSGSVVPLFLEQIREGGPVTVTHPEVTRYFMTISEAAQLVVQAGSMGRNGEVFVLDMGEPVMIRDLAAKMIQLAGFQVRTPEHPTGDIEIAYTGLRPGEKLYEELLIGDNPEGTTHPRIFHARDPFLPLPQLSVSIDAMVQAIKRDELPRLMSEIRSIVREFKDRASEPTLPSNVAQLPTRNPMTSGRSH